MKKSWNLLFIITVLATSIALASCGGNRIQEDFCIFSSFTDGQLNLASCAEIPEPPDNIKFWVDGEELSFENLPTKNWVRFQKIDPSQVGFFVIRTNRAACKTKELTNVRVAKQSNYPFCPRWAKSIFGNYCEADDFPVW